MQNEMKIKAALFDLDGVVFDTEPQYTKFWKEIGLKYRPDVESFEYRIKGMTMKQIFEKFFAGMEEELPEIIDSIDKYEEKMHYEYVAGVPSFVEDLRKNGVRTAIVTSSNQAKMASVYTQRPALKVLFDEILTSEDFAESKPSPDCYLKAAARFGLLPDHCVVFEDSFNGLKSGRASGAYVIGLSTTNKPSEIQPFCDFVLSDFSDVNTQKLNEIIVASE